MSICNANDNSNLRVWENISIKTERGIENDLESDGIKWIFLVANAY